MQLLLPMLPMLPMLLLPMLSTAAAARRTNPPVHRLTGPPPTPRWPAFRRDEVDYLRLPHLAAKPPAGEGGPAEGTDGGGMASSEVQEQVLPCRLAAGGGCSCATGCSGAALLTVELFWLLPPPLSLPPLPLRVRQASFIKPLMAEQRRHVSCVGDGGN